MLACSVKHQPSKLELACPPEYMQQSESPSLLPYHSASLPDNTPNPSSTRKPQQAPPLSPPPLLQPHTLTVPDYVQGGLKASPEAVAESGKYGWNWNPFTVSEAA